MATLPFNAFCDLQFYFFIICSFFHLSRGRGELVRYSIADWRRHNTVLDYHCPCQKETGFFFIPVSTAADLVSMGRCSEMDIILDLWISAVYNDERVQGSFTGPVFYFRNGTGNPLISYSALSERWEFRKQWSAACYKNFQGKATSRF